MPSRSRRAAASRRAARVETEPRRVGECRRPARGPATRERPAPSVPRAPAPGTCRDREVVARDEAAARPAERDEVERDEAAVRPDERDEVERDEVERDEVEPVRPAERDEAAVRPAVRDEAVPVDVRPPRVALLRVRGGAVVVGIAREGLVVGGTGGRGRTRFDRRRFSRPAERSWWGWERRLPPARPGASPARAGGTRPCRARPGRCGGSRRGPAAGSPARAAPCSPAGWR